MYLTQSAFYLMSLSTHQRNAICEPMVTPLSDVYCRVSNPASLQFRANIGPPAKRHLNGVSLVDRLKPAILCLLGKLALNTGLMRGLDLLSSQQFVLVLNVPVSNFSVMPGSAFRLLVANQYYKKNSSGLSVLSKDTTK